MLLFKRCKITMKNLHNQEFALLFFCRDVETLTEQQFVLIEILIF